MTNRARGFVFTINNYTQDDIAHLKCNDKQVRYICFGLEVAPSTGTKHIQGYIYFHNAKTPELAKKFIGNNGTHIELAKGTAQQNQAYCSKEGEFYECGEIPKQGARNDITQIKDLVNNGASMADIISDATSYQTLRTAELLLKYQKPVKREKPNVKWFFGPTGTGKTKQAWDELGFDDTWISGKNLKWWDGYSGQKHVIIDDFRADFCTFHELLRILDRYPYRVEVKGSSQWLCATDIIITSAYKPDEVYQTREDIGQLLRRIDCVIPFEKTQNT